MSHSFRESRLHMSAPQLAASRVIFSLAQAVLATAWSALFVGYGFSDSQFSQVKLMAGLVSIVASLAMPYLLQRLDEAKTYPISLIISGLLLNLLLVSKVPTVLVLIYVVAQILFIARTSTFSILFRDSFRSLSEYSYVYGFVASIVCLSWFIGPIIGGMIISKDNLNGAVIFSSLLYVLSGLLAILRIRKHATRKVTASKNPLLNLRSALKQRGFKSAYLLKSGVDAWWTLVFSFVNLLMIREGYSLAYIGVFIGLTQLPLVFTEFLTVWTIRKFGFRKIFAACYTTLSIIVMSVLFFGAGNLGLGLIILGSIPLAFLEPITEIYFFKLTSRDSEELSYPVFLTSSIFGEVGLSLMIWILLAFFSLSLSLIAAAFYMFAMILVAVRSVK